VRPTNTPASAISLAILLLVAQACSGQGSTQLSLDAFGSQVSSESSRLDTGLTARFSELIPGVGLVTGTLAGASSTGDLKRGASFLRFSSSSLAAGQLNVSIGDQEIPLDRISQGQLHSYYLPPLLFSGASASLSRSGSEVSVFGGTEFLLSGPRISQIAGTNQQIAGALTSWKLRQRLTLGNRLLLIRNGESRPANWYQSPISSMIRDAGSVSSQILWNPFGSLSLFGELGSSWSHVRNSNPELPNQLSSLAGLQWRTKRFEADGAYLRQAPDYLPLASYYLGSRSGFTGEFRFQPRTDLLFFVSLSNLESALSLSPAIYQRSRVSSLGTTWNHGRITASANLTRLGMASSVSPSAGDLRANRLLSATLSQQRGRHTVRLGFEDLSVRTSLLSRQYVAEFGDSIRLGHLNFGGTLRLERQLNSETRNRVAERLFWNHSWRRLSTYGSFELGKDLANSSFLTRTGSRTTTFGLASSIGRGWELRTDAYRSNLLIDLAGNNIALFTQNGYTPANILQSNQWTAYASVSRTLSWAGGRSPAQVAELAKASISETGTVEGLVFGLHDARRKLGLSKIPVQLDHSRFTLTDGSGAYKFNNVPEGQHVVGLDTWHLPADYEPLAAAETDISVTAHHSTSSQFQVQHLGLVQGTVSGLPPSSATIVELDGGVRTTTIDNDGAFSFDNLPEGVHRVELRLGSLPADYSVPSSSSHVIEVACNGQATANFTAAYLPKQKPVRQIYLDASAAVSERK
jgi:hypothetical protein